MKNANQKSQLELRATEEMKEETNTKINSKTLPQRTQRKAEDTELNAFTAKFAKDATF